MPLDVQTLKKRLLETSASEERLVSAEDKMRGTHLK